VKLKIDGVEYQVKPMPLHLSPYAARMSELLQKVPTDLSEADEMSKEIEQLQSKIFAETVSPEVRKEHTIELYNAVNDLTREIMKKAGLFRESKQSKQHSAKGGAVKPAAS